VERAAIDEYIQLMDKPQDLLHFIRQTQAQFIQEDIVVESKNQDDLDVTVATGCSSTILFKVNGLTGQVPRLIVFINSFLHISTSMDHCLRHFKLTGQFWSVFSNLSELGETARLYLLKTHTLGRLIDILLNLHQDQFFSKEAMQLYTQKFRDESLQGFVPMFVYTS
jgi:hypothetical protein